MPDCWAAAVQATVCANFGLECIVYMGAKVSCSERRNGHSSQSESCPVSNSTTCHVSGMHWQQGACPVQVMQADLSSVFLCHPLDQKSCLRCKWQFSG